MDVKIKSIRNQMGQLESIAAKKLKETSSLGKRAALELVFRTAIAQGRELMKKMSSFCLRKSRSAHAELMRFMGKMQTETCKVYAQPYELVLERQDNNTWISNEGPSGWCGTIKITKISRDPKYEFGWTYEEHSIYTRKENILCKGLKNQKAEFSWLKDIKVQHCEHIKFGL